MLSYQLNEETGILALYPEGPLTAQDFHQVASVVDPYIERDGAINGLLIKTETFPGWSSFSAVISHFKFVREHHQKIKKIALVTNSKIANSAEIIVKHFISAEIKHFDYNSEQNAIDWILKSNLAS